MKEKDLSKLTAVALEYNPEEDAPKVVASGKGAIAQKILEKVRKQAFQYTRMINWLVLYQSWKLVI